MRRLVAFLFSHARGRLMTQYERDGMPNIDMAERRWPTRRGQFLPLIISSLKFLNARGSSHVLDSRREAKGPPAVLLENIFCI